MEDPQWFGITNSFARVGLSAHCVEVWDEKQQAWRSYTIRPQTSNAEDA